MGDWTLILAGTGAHHNNDPKGTYGANGCEEDADQRLLEFAERLAADGHQLRHAAIVHGSGADVVEFEYVPSPGATVRLSVIRYRRADGTVEDAQARLKDRAIRRGLRTGRPAADG